MVQEKFGNEDALTNFESDNRRQSNPYKYKEQLAAKEEEKYAKAQDSDALKQYESKSAEKEKLIKKQSSTKFVGIISQHASPGVREIPKNTKES